MFAVTERREPVSEASKSRSRSVQRCRRVLSVATGSAGGRYVAQARDVDHEAVQAVKRKETVETGVRMQQARCSGRQRIKA